MGKIWITASFFLINLLFLVAGSSVLHMGFLQLQPAGASHCGGCSDCRAQAAGTWASVVVVHRFTCSVACGIFLDQGLNSCPLQWQADSQPLYHQGSSHCLFLYRKFVGTQPYSFMYYLWLLRDNRMCVHAKSLRLSDLL